VLETASAGLPIALVAESFARVLVRLSERKEPTTRARLLRAVRFDAARGKALSCFVLARAAALQRCAARELGRPGPFWLRRAARFGFAQAHVLWIYHLSASGRTASFMRAVGCLGLGVRGLDFRDDWLELFFGMPATREGRARVLRLMSETPFVSALLVLVERGLWREARDFAAMAEARHCFGDATESVNDVFQAGGTGCHTPDQLVDFAESHYLYRAFACLSPGLTVDDQVEILSRAPEDGRTLSMLGELLIHLGKSEAGDRVLRRAMALGDRQAPMLLATSRALVNGPGKGKWDEPSSRLMKESIRRGAKMEAQPWMATYYHQRGMMNESRRMMRMIGRSDGLFESDNPLTLRCAEAWSALNSPRRCARFARLFLLGCTEVQIGVWRQPVEIARSMIPDENTRRALLLAVMLNLGNSWARDEAPPVPQSVSAGRAWRP
jgi:hypothetical protein